MPRDLKDYQEAVRRVEVLRRQQAIWEARQQDLFLQSQKLEEDLKAAGIIAGSLEEAKAMLMQRIDEAFSALDSAIETAEQQFEKMRSQYEQA